MSRVGLSRVGYGTSLIVKWVDVTIDVGRGFVIFKTPVARILCLLASFTFERLYKGYYSNH